MERMMIEYYSQIGQDQYYIEKIAKFKKNGFFLDIGANNGIHTSNTAALEFFLGWSGICIEANPVLISDLIKNRPNSKVVNVATWNQNTEVELELTNSNLDNVEGHLLSRISKIERNEKYFQNHFQESRNVIKVQANTVNSILQNLNLFPCKIDYASIDTEGAELETLQGIDFTQIDIKFLTVEFGGRKKYLKELQKYLESFGYQLHRVNRWDAEFFK
jgi:FkbM family methyltransferase